MVDSLRFKELLSSCWLKFLTPYANYRILICMRTTLILEDSLLEEAASITGITQKTALVNTALEALIAREVALRLSKIGGTQPNLQPIPRRHVE